MIRRLLRRRRRPAGPPNFAELYAQAEGQALATIDLAIKRGGNVHFDRAACEAIELLEELNA